jgi:alpha-L-rhamnosidase
VMSWRDYLLFSGDETTTRQLYDCARRIMVRLEELAGENGLLNDPPAPYWIDHANLDRRGENFTINALYALTLDHYADVLEWLHEPGHTVYRDRAGNLRDSLRERFWDEQRGLFVDVLVDGNPSGRFSEHANGIALATDIAGPEQVSSIVAEILHPGEDFVQSTSLFIYWPFIGLCRNGFVDEGFAMLEKKFQHQYQVGNRTLWEEWYLDTTFRRGFAQKTSRCDAQGEPAVFPMAMMEWSAGIEIASPGFKIVLIRRPSHSLGTVRAKMPAPQGEVAVNWEDRKGGCFLETSVPEGIEARLDLRSLQIPKGANLWLNGNKLNRSTLKGEWLVLPVGNHYLKLQ